MSTSNNHSNTSGIDFRQALEILSLRAAESTSSNENANHPDVRSLHSGSTSVSSCPCCRQPSVPESVKQLGQLIDLHPVSYSDKSEVSSLPGDDELKRQKQELDATRSRRRQELLAEIQGMSVATLLRAVMAAQQQRVATYKSYDRYVLIFYRGVLVNRFSNTSPRDRSVAFLGMCYCSGLETVLHTRNLALYPAMVADATASFAVLSDTINAIQLQLASQPDDDGSLQSHGRYNRTDLKTIVHRLQTAEQQKLSLTAALHLEQIRHQVVASSDANSNGIDDAATASRLLEEGVQTLRSRVSACVDSINEIIDELQCAMVDEEERGDME
jgi:hypothetical protein